MIANIIDLILKQKDSHKFKSRTVTGTIILVAILSLVSSSLPGELIKDVTQSFDYGIYDSKIDGIRNNMGCATIVGKAEERGLACMQNLFNKCNNIKQYSFISNCLIFVIIMMLVFNKKENESKYKTALFITVVCLILNMLVNYMTIILKVKSINSENCGLKNMENTKMKFGASFYLNITIMVIFTLLSSFMTFKYQNILF
jgi:hypothetical protein